MTRNDNKPVGSSEGRTQAENGSPPWFSLLACPKCHCPLHRQLDRLQCGCGHCYEIQGSRVNFGIAAEERAALAAPGGRAMAQGYRSGRRTLKALRRVISSEYFPGRAWRTARARVAERRPLLVLGSGTSRMEGAIHLDLDAFPGVDVVGDGQALPFASCSLQGVLCEVVLEHVRDPSALVAEVERVLAPGGELFFIVPFLFPYHAHPSDYRRWSLEGLRQEFAAFEELSSGVHAGPSSAWVNLCSDWLVLLAGARTPKARFFIKGLATALLFPLKFLDVLVLRREDAHALAATLFFHARKPSA